MEREPGCLVNVLLPTITHRHYHTHTVNCLPQLPAAASASSVVSVR